MVGSLTSDVNKRVLFIDLILSIFAPNSNTPANYCQVIVPKLTPPTDFLSNCWL